MLNALDRGGVRGNGRTGARGREEVGSHITLNVALVHAPGDADIASTLAALLAESGAAVVPFDSSPPPDGIVVLLSKDAFEDARWLPPPEVTKAAHLIPVRLGKIDHEQVPRYLRELNWIDWNPDRPATTLGFVVAALLSDPSRYRISRQLAHEAVVWQVSGRRREHLIGDRRRAQQMVKLLRDLVDDPIASPDPLTVAFVAASNRSTRKTRVRRWLIRGGACVAVLAAISAAVTVIPRIEANGRINHAAIVTSGSQVILDQMPEWSAANAAVLVVEGSGTERELGRHTLIQALGHQWEVADAFFLDSVIATSTYAHGTRGLALTVSPRGSAVAVINLQTDSLVKWRVIPGRFDVLDSESNGRFALVAGEGAKVMSVHTGKVRTLGSGTEFSGARLLGDEAALWTSHGTLELRNLHSSASTRVGDYEAVLDVGGGPRAGSALVRVAPGDYEIVSLPSGRLLSQAHIAGGGAIGALSPDGREGVVEGGDGQFWIVAPSGARPTGITVPVALTAVAWGTRQRLVVAGESARTRVYYLPRGELLGTVCGNAPDVSQIALEAPGERVACGGASRSYWELPPSPRPARPGAARSTPRRQVSPYATAKIHGGQVRIWTRGPLGRAVIPGGKPFDARITAAAFDPAAHQLALGSARGGVIVLGLTRRGSRVVVSWNTPDAAAVDSLHWNGGLTADTASGQAWTVPSCPECQTEAGMLAAAKARFTRCFSARQVEWIDAPTREELGIRECIPLTVLGEG